MFKRAMAVGAGAAAMLTASMAGQAYGQLTWRTVALTGTDGVYGPGLGAGVTYTWVGQAALNSSGQAAYSASTLSGAFQGDGVWLRPDNTSTSSNLKLYMGGEARPGSAPGGPFTAATFPAGAGYLQLSLNNAGQTTTRQGTTGIVSTSGTTSGTLTVGRVAYGGDVAPGSGGANYAAAPIAAGNPFLNQAGQTAFVGTMTGTGVVTTAGSNNSAGLFIGTPDNSNNPSTNVAMVIRSDTFAGMTGLSSTVKIGTTFANIGFNDNGRYLAQNTLQGSGVVTGTVATSNSVALISNRTGSNDVIAQVGQPAPDATGAPSATDVYRAFSFLGSPINNLNHVAYVASLRTAGTATQTVASAIFSDVNGGVTGGTMKQVYASGQTLPNIYARGNSTTPLPEFSGLTFSTSSTFQTVMLNGNDQMLFSANFSAGGQAYLLRDQAGDLHKVVRTGDNLLGGIDPLTTGGTGTSTVSGISGVSLNLLGQAAFTTNLTGPGVSVGLGNGSALWFSDVDGSLFLVARTGTAFTNALGVTRTISGINVASGSGGQNGFVTGLSDSGELVYKLDFTDQTSGVFAFQIPAPGAASLLALGGLVAARRRRR